jgi:hypothetical protein
MQNFRIFEQGYTMPEPEAKWSYNVGAFVVCVKDFSEAFNVNVRTA